MKFNMFTADLTTQIPPDEDVFNLVSVDEGDITTLDATKQSPKNICN